MYFEKGENPQAVWLERRGVRELRAHGGDDAIRPEESGDPGGAHGSAEGAEAIHRRAPAGRAAAEEGQGRRRGVDIQKSYEIILRPALGWISRPDFNMV